MGFFFEVLCGVVLFLFLLYRYLIATYNFWKKRDVVGPDPVLIFGTMKNLILKKESPAIHWKRLYDAYKDAQFVGLFEMREPMLLIKHPKHIKDVFIKDSSVFLDRGYPNYPNVEPLYQFLFFLDGQLVRLLRMKMSPNFTPIKIKEIFYTMQESIKRLENYMDTLLSKSNYVLLDFTDITRKLTVDIIANSFMGIDMKTLSTESNEKNEFLKHNERMIIKPKNQIIRMLMIKILPKLYNLFGYYLLDNKKLTEFYTDFIFDLIDYRKKHNIVKSDFVNLLMELSDNRKELGEINDNFFGAQMFGFFIAAFDTSGLTIANTIYELALNQSIQTKLRNEIQTFYAKTGEITFDDVNALTYLDAVVKETLRKYPVSDSIRRKSTSSYTFRDTNVTIPKDQKIIIPVYAIHHDPNIYPKPEIYDPERFSDKAVRSRDPMHFIPFGHGPRKCIGERLGALQTKMGLIGLLRKYKMDVCAKTPTLYRYNLTTFVQTPNEPIYLKVSKID